MRIVNLLFLCFSLAFVNVSYAHNFVKDCPMEQGSHSDSMQMTLAISADCCNDAATAAMTGEHCNPAQSCHASPTVLIFSVPSLSFTATDRDTEPSVTVAVPHLLPATLWRPPTLS